MAADKGRATGRIAQQLNAGLIARRTVLHVGTARLGSRHSACRCPGKAVSRQCGCAATGCRPPRRLPRHAFHASRTPASNRHPPAAAWPLCRPTCCNGTGNGGRNAQKQPRPPAPSDGAGGRGIMWLLPRRRPWPWRRGYDAAQANRQNSADFGVRGNGMTSRMFCMPVTKRMRRSKPKPNPP